MYPNARVIHCRRDARDVGLSCFQQNFTQGYPWSCNLEHIGHYINVFIYLLIGTVLTVVASYIELNVKDSIAGAIFIGLLIASIKGYLVAANFMHLNSEKKMIYWILILTVFFLVLLLFVPLLWDLNNMGNS